MDSYVARKQCGSRKNYKKSAVGKEKLFGALLADLSKPFDCLSNELFTERLRFRLNGTKTYSKLPIKQKVKYQNQFDTYIHFSWPFVI